MSKSPRKILEQLFLDAIADGGTGGSMEDVVSKAAAEIKEAVLASMPNYKPTSKYAPSDTWVGYNRALDDIEQAILTMFEGE